MATEVTVELLVGDEVIPVGSVSEAEPPGSISSQELTGRRVFVFGWYEGEPGVWESHGADIESSLARQLMSARLVKLSDLTESYEQAIWRGDTPLGRARFTLR